LTTGKKKSNLIIFIIVAALLIAALVLVFVQRSTSDMPTADFALRVIAGGQIKDFTIEEIKAFPSVSVEKEIVSSKSDDEKGVFSGVALETLIKDVVPDNSKSFSEYIFTAADGFMASIYASDVDKGENVLIVYEKDGKPIKSREDGGHGPLRLIIADDEFGNRNAYYLKIIEAKK